jgi:glutamyl-tRNA synthetase
MHLGNVFCAVLSWLSAKSKGGEWLLRIEDLDPQRSKMEFAKWIMDDLQWLGLEWDEGPIFNEGQIFNEEPKLNEGPINKERISSQGSDLNQGNGFKEILGSNGPYFQSERSDIYGEYLKRLQEKGLVYPCYCTRNDILATQAPHESDGRVVYKGTCRSIVPGSRTGEAALRLMVPDKDITCHDGLYGEYSVNLTKEIGDFIVRRKDGAWAYQLAVVVDDALMGVTEVVRGRDLLLSTPQQTYMAQLLGFPTPSFTHIPLLCNEAHQRLSKRDRSLDMAVLRQQYTASELLGWIAQLANLIPNRTSLSAKELINLFDLNRIPKEDIVIRNS